MINEARIGYYRLEPRIDTPRIPTRTWALCCGIPNVAPTLLPGGLPLSVGGPTTNILENFTARDDMTWVHGYHSFKFGYDLLHERQNSYNLGSPSGTFSFDGDFSGLTGNWNHHDSQHRRYRTGFLLMLGSVSSASFSIPTASWLPRDNINSFYAQDDWRLSTKLTLNIGVRYVNESIRGTPNTVSGRSSSATTPDTLVPGDMGASILHPGGNMNNRHNLNFELRLGFAWVPARQIGGTRRLGDDARGSRPGPQPTGGIQHFLFTD